MNSCGTGSTHVTPRALCAMQVSGLIAFEIVVVALILLLALQRSIRSFGAAARRWIAVFAAVGLVALLVVYLVLIGKNASAGFTSVILLAAANYVAGTIIVQLCLYGAPYHRLSMVIVDAGYYAADTIAGLVIFALIFLFSLVPIVDSIQALLLFNYELLKESRTGQQLKQFLARRGRAGGASVLGGAGAGGGAGGDGKGKASPPGEVAPPAALPSAAAGLPQGHAAGNGTGSSGSGPGTGGSNTNRRTQYANLGATIMSTQRASALTGAFYPPIGLGNRVGYDQGGYPEPHPAVGNAPRPIWPSGHTPGGGGPAV
jgi:hypothetical protein